MLPLLLVLLHSVVPHSHYSDRLNATSVLRNNELSNTFLSELFQVDLGTHHLEEYSISDHQFDIVLPECDLPIASLLLEMPVKDLTQEFYILVQVPFQDHFIHTSQSLRAPPVLLG